MSGTLDLENFATARRSSQVLSTLVDRQCDKLVTVFGHQFITLTVYICVQHGGREPPRGAGLSAAVETCLHFAPIISWNYIYLIKVKGPEATYITVQLQTNKHGY